MYCRGDCVRNTSYETGSLCASCRFCLGLKATAMTHAGPSKTAKLRRLRESVQTGRGNMSMQGADGGGNLCRCANRSTRLCVRPQRVRGKLPRCLCAKSSSRLSCACEGAPPSLASPALGHASHHLTYFQLHAQHAQVNACSLCHVNPGRSHTDQLGGPTIFSDSYGCIHHVLPASWEEAKQQG